MAGWVKLHRKIKDWGWYRDGVTARIFLHCLIKAAYEEDEYRGIPLRPGSFITGRSVMAAELALTENQIRGGLERLSKCREITIKKYAKYSIVSVVNWSQYQDDPPAFPPEEGGVRPPAFPPSPTPHLKKKEERRKKKDPIAENARIDSCAEFLMFWSAYPRFRRGDKSASFSAWEKVIREGKTTADKLLDSVNRYARSDEVTKEGGKYAKGCVAWLRASRFDDEYAPPKQSVPHRPYTGRQFEDVKREMGL